MRRSDVPVKSLHADDVRLIANQAVRVIHAYLSRGPSSTLATINEREAIDALRQTLDAIDRVYRAA
jgi:hypothetical protein